MNIISYYDISYFVYPAEVVSELADVYFLRFVCLLGSKNLTSFAHCSYTKLLYIKCASIFETIEGYTHKE